jgi:hypothetical protein
MRRPLPSLAPASLTPGLSSFPAPDGTIPTTDKKISARTAHTPRVPWSPRMGVPVERHPGLDCSPS